MIQLNIIHVGFNTILMNLALLMCICLYNDFRLLPLQVYSCFHMLLMVNDIYKLLTNGRSACVPK